MISIKISLTHEGHEDRAKVSRQAHITIQHAVLSFLEGWIIIFQEPGDLFMEMSPEGTDMSILCNPL